MASWPLKWQLLFQTPTPKHPTPPPPCARARSPPPQVKHYLLNAQNKKLHKRNVHMVEDSNLILIQERWNTGWNPQEKLKGHIYIDISECCREFSLILPKTTMLLIKFHKPYSWISSFFPCRSYMQRKRWLNIFGSFINMMHFFVFYDVINFHVYTWGIYWYL